MRKTPLVLLAALVATLALAPLSSTAVDTDTTALRNAVTVAGIMAHEKAFQKIADQNKVDGVPTRTSGTPGYDASVQYVVDKLNATGHYNVTVQNFNFEFWEETAAPVLEQVMPNQKTYAEGADFFTMEYSGSGDVTAQVQPVDVTIPPSPTPSSTSGCEATDFAGFVSGRIALIQRGTCTFREKADNAKAAGAIGVIIFNEGQPGRTDAFGGTLSPPLFDRPVVGTSFAVGEELYNLANSGGVTVHLATTTQITVTPSKNVLAETKTGLSDRTVVVGAHLDSVPEGPGINDNGSGSSTILETAIQMAKLNIQPTNRVRFAWWGAEESGLIGSTHYVSQLSKREIKNIALNLNFDMVGSPNFVRFVYDGDGSDTPAKGPTGSANIEDVFNDYFASQGLETDPTAFDGRSDYGPFIAVGIPAGGLFTGAEGIKTAEQAAVYGGTAGVAYDPCYHQLCDRITNVNTLAIDQMSDGVAHATLVFAMTSSAVPGTDKGKAMGHTEFKGSKLQK